MIDVTLLCVGGLKESFWKAACAEYGKRLGGRVRLRLIEIDEAYLPADPSEAQIRAALETEAAVIAKRLPENAFITALCVEGGQMDSQAFSELLGQRMQLGSRLAFVIGGSNGLADSVKQKANLRLSFSAMTFPHMLARVVLLEQLYRAVNLLQGGKYHK